MKRKDFQRFLPWFFGTGGRSLDGKSLFSEQQRVETIRRCLWFPFGNLEVFTVAAGRDLDLMGGYERPPPRQSGFQHGRVSI